MEAIRARHSVRNFTEQKIEGDFLEAVKKEVQQVGHDSSMRFKLIVDDPEVFNSPLARGFSNARNCIVISGKKGSDFEVDSGYYGEKLVLIMQQMGLNTCWIAVTFNRSYLKKKLELKYGEKIIAIIALGYGVDQGKPHQSKSFQQICKSKGPFPPWFEKGMEAAMMAPTAMNKQNFTIDFDGSKVELNSGRGRYRYLDMGIVKFHFECGTGMRFGVVPNKEDTGKM